MLKSETKKVIEKCINYMDIMNEKYPKNDIISENIIRYYKAVITHTHYNDNDEVNVAMLLDKSVYAYFNNNKFNEIIINGLQSADRQINLGEFLIRNYKAFESDPVNKAAATRWI